MNLILSYNKNITPSNPVLRNISENEIKMPDEHVGELREGYRWKVMLKRDEDAVYLPCGQISTYNKTLFSLIWGPTGNRRKEKV